MINAVTASVAPSDNAPASPMITCAGWTLNHRNPSRAPMMSAHIRARFDWFGVLSSAMSMNATNEMASVPPESPSSPSVRLTPLAVATMAKAAKST